MPDTSIIPFQQEPDDRGRENEDRFKRLRDARQQWDRHAREDLDFYLGDHFSAEEKEDLAERNQSDVPFDRISANVEQMKAMLTARPPRFTVAPREGSDAKKAEVWKIIMEYIWNISSGDDHFKQAIHDYAVTGLGFLYAYVDYNADYGRGEVKFKHLSPFQVFVDPYTQMRYWDDANEVVVTTKVTKEQLLDMLPQLESDIDSIPTTQEDDFPHTEQADTQNTYTPDEIDGLDGQHVEKFRIIERFTKISVMFFRLKDGQTGQDQVIDAKELQQFLNNPKFNQFFISGRLQIEQTEQTRIQRVMSIGNYFIEEETLPTEHYPVVPMPNVWTQTPYPMGDVRKTKDMQRFLNKMFSVVMSHAQASAGLKLLIPEGSVEDKSEVEKRWANPNAAITYNAAQGEPHVASVPPLGTVHYSLIQQAERYIDRQFGIYEMQLGNPEAAPRTAAATMMMEDFGQRRIKSKLRDVEGSLGRLGQVIYNLAKDHYTHQKMFRVVQPNNETREAQANVAQMLYDDRRGVVQQIKNDITQGQEDVRIVKGSTMPSNIWGLHQIAMEMYQAGVVDDVEVLKHTEIFDKEGVLQRKSLYTKMQSAIKSLEEYISNLEGDLQTATRESVNDRKRVEIEKWKTRLNEIKTDFELNVRKTQQNYEATVKKAEDEIDIVRRNQQSSQGNGSPQRQTIG